jgi:hypothetical protein
MRFLVRRLLVVAVVVIVVGGLIGDRVAKGYAESSIETGVRREVRGVSDVDASISSFPFLGRLLLQGKVSHFRLTLHDVVGHQVPVEELRLDVDGLELDRGSLLDGDDVEVTGVDHVRFRAVITRENVESVLGPLTDVAFALADGTTLRVAGGRVELGAGVSFPVPGRALLPCDATATIAEGRVEVECSADRLPQIVLDAIGSLELRQG